MNEAKVERRKKLPRIRRLHNLAALRREMVRVYEEARDAGPDPLNIQYFRALAFILSSAAETMKAEKLEEYESRIKALEENTGEKRQEQ